MNEPKIGMYGYELINGDIVEVPPLLAYHYALITEIVAQIYQKHKDDLIVLAGPYKIYIDDDNIFLPEVICFKKDKEEEAIEGDRIYRSADVVCEVLNSQTICFDLDYKIKKYKEIGCKEYWIIDPYTLDVKGYIYTDEDFYKVESKKFIDSAFLTQEIQLGTILVNEDSDF